MSRPINSSGRTWRQSARLARLVAALHTTIRTLRGAHEYGVVTVDPGRTRPHAADVVAVVGDE